ncbi:LuxR C-terminal-related transcriptional regulator [Horticoccus sp. 23ND18S-11]|uniref:LuxR C-terminal-related transcriptional regulator n=1 Tax=Horticoccus sp. 23ND18S-11 TaxID=3391832 RepID=UPI0039C9F13A
MLTPASSFGIAKPAPAFTRHALITVSIVHDNASYRTSLGQALARFPGVVVFDKCATAREATQALAERPPRVLFAGHNLPDAPDWDFVESLPRLRLSTQVIAVSTSEAVADVHTALRAGAMGYLLLNTPLPLVHQALHDITSGGAPLTPSVARALVASFSAPAGENGLLADLTTRESEVLDMLSRGLRYRQIATMMRLSPDTVHSHAKKVYRKLGVRSKTEAAMIWMRSLSDSDGPPKLMSLGLPAVA